MKFALLYIDELRPIILARAKDLGIHLKMLTAGNVEQTFTFMDFPIFRITLVETDTYMVDSSIVLDGETYFR